jgi:cytochrome c biogenesis protein CcdA
MKQNSLKLISNLCFVLGFISIFGSIAIWALSNGTTIEAQAESCECEIDNQGNEQTH